MKQFWKIKLIVIFGLALLFLGGTKADTITLSVAAVPGGSGTTTNFTVPTNTVAQIISEYCITANWHVSNITIVKSGAAATFSGNAAGVISNLPMIVGPAMIALTATNLSAANPLTLSFCTIQLSPAVSTLNFSPSTAVVIPDDNGGPVAIVLESSTDLVNWTPALPGTYGTTSSNRFFRVRATR